MINKHSIGMPKRKLTILNSNFGSTERDFASSEAHSVSSSPATASNFTETATRSLSRAS
jgi:hypothetical protein